MRYSREDAYLNRRQLTGTTEWEVDSPRRVEVQSAFLNDQRSWRPSAGLLDRQELLARCMALEPARSTPMPMTVTVGAHRGDVRCDCTDAKDAAGRHRQTCVNELLTYGDLSPAPLMDQSFRLELLPDGRLTAAEVPDEPVRPLGSPESCAPQQSVAPGPWEEWRR